MVIDMFLEPEKTNPFLVLALISICLIGAIAMLSLRQRPEAEKLALGKR